MSSFDFNSTARTMLHDADVCGVRGVGEPACLGMTLDVSWIGRHVPHGLASSIPCPRIVV